MDRTRHYASVVWTVDDVQELREDYSDEQAAAFLERNEGHLRDRLVERGWDVLGDLLQMDEAEAKAKEREVRDGSQ